MKTNFEVWVAERWESQRKRENVFVPPGVPYPLTAALGLPGEVGEVLELLKKHFRDGKHPGDDLVYELGDVLHYLVVIAQAYGFTLHDLMSLNQGKLERRDAQKAAVLESMRREMQGDEE